MRLFPSSNAGRPARMELRLALAGGWLALPTAFLLGARPTSALLLGLGSIALVQLALFLLARDVRAARGCILLTTVQGFVAATVTPDLLGGPIALVAFALTLYAQIALAEHGARKALPARLPHTPGAHPREGRLQGGMRALATALAVLCLAASGSILLSALASALAGGREDERALSEQPEDADPLRDADPAGANDAQRIFDGAFPEDLEWATAAPLRDDTPVIVLRPQEAGEEHLAFAPLHVRGRVLERFTRTGLGAHDGVVVSMLDGMRDVEGWASLAPVPSGEVALECWVEQMPLRIGERTESLLFTPTPLVALDCPGARLQPGREAHAPLPEGPLLRFRTRSLERRFERCAIPEQAASDAPPSTTQLPPASPELATIQATALEVTRGAGNDRERVARVLAYFRDRFEYDPKPDGVPGLAGLVDFLDRRSGGCTLYAATATLMLRSLGVPARVATGFLARPLETEFGSLASDSLVATPRSAHAWFEVPFVGLGWVTCDPTPAAASALGAGAFDLLGERPWWADGAEILAGFLDGRSVSLARVGEALSDLGARLGGWTGLGAASGALALLWIFLRKRRGRAGESTESSSLRSDRDNSPLARLLLAFSRAGFPRPPARTLREHAQRLTTRDSTTLQPLEGLVETLYRTRFGGGAWSEGDARELARVCAALEAGDRVPRR